MGRVSLLQKIPFGSPEYQAASEHLHQAAFVEYMDINFRDFHDLFYAIPNGGSRNKIEAINLVLEGVKAGIPDTHLPVPVFWAHNKTVRYHSLYLEFKDMKKSSKPSDKQIQKIERLRNFGNAAFVVHGWKQAECCFLWYMGRMSESDVLLSSGLNFSEQLSHNYGPDSWRFPL